MMLWSQLMAIIRDPKVRIPVLVYCSVGIFILLIAAFALTEASDDNETFGTRIFDISITVIGGDFWEFILSITMKVTYYGVLSWGLIATIVLFQPFVQRNTIDLELTKPISRSKLFFLKYISGIFLTTSILFIYVLSIYLIFGIRFDKWIHSILLAGFYIQIAYITAFTFAILMLFLIKQYHFVVVGMMIHVFALSSALFDRERLLFSIIDSAVIRGVIEIINISLPPLKYLEAEAIGLFIDLSDITAGNYLINPFLQSFCIVILCLGISLWILVKTDY